MNNPVKLDALVLSEVHMKKNDSLTLQKIDKESYASRCIVIPDETLELTVFDRNILK